MTSRANQEYNLIHFSKYIVTETKGSYTKWAAMTSCSFTYVGELESKHSWSSQWAEHGSGCRRQQQILAIKQQTYSVDPNIHPRDV